MALWRRFRPGGGERPADALGQVVHLEGVAHTVVGVMPDGFDFPVGRVLLWEPYRPERTARRVTALGVLKAGATMPASRPGAEVQVTSFIRKDPTISLALQSVFGAAALLLLIAIANTANVLLADAVRRDADLAVRVSLGATWWRLARQVSTEGLLLSGAAAVTALVLSRWALGVLVTRIPYLLFFQALRPIALDWRALTFAIVVTSLAGLGSSGLSIARARRLNATTVLRGQTSGLRAQTRSRTVLTVAQLAVSMALVAGAALLTASLHRLAVVEPGYNAAHLVRVLVQIPTWRYPDDAQVQAALAGARDEAAQAPGVLGATVSYSMPPDLSQTPAASLEIEGGATIDPSRRVAYARADPWFFSTLGLPVVAGRVFDARDRREGQPVAVVSRSLAEALSPNGAALGRRFRESREAPWLTVVGIVGDIRSTGVDSSATTLGFYTPRTQSPAWWYEGLIVRTRGEPASVVSDLRAVLHRAMPEAPVIEVTTGSEALQNTNARVRFTASLMAAFAGLALALAIVGVYATFWFAVRQRTREIGVRLALGASPMAIRRMVVRRGIGLTIAGLAAGLPLALVATRSVRSLVVGATVSEPLMLVVVMLGLAAAATAATSIPAWIASRVDPVGVLRHS